MWLVPWLAVASAVACLIVVCCCAFGARNAARLEHNTPARRKDTAR